MREWAIPDGPYHAPRRHEIAPEQEAAIRANAGERRVRFLADEFGVSREKVRTTPSTAGAVAVVSGLAAG